MRALGLHLPAADLARAEAVLARGGVVVLGQAPADVHAGDGDRRGVRPERGAGAVRRPALAGPGDPARRPRHHPPGAGRGVPRGRAPHGYPVVTTSLLVRGVTIDQASEDAINEAAQGVDPNASLYVERGFHDSSTSVALLVLGVLGAVLVLGGTLTATFLALSDARPDFATMGAVGAGPADPPAGGVVVRAGDRVGRRGARCASSARCRASR